MINYSLNQSNRKGVTKGKWYARAVHLETVDLRGLAEHMCSHHCSYSKGQILGLLDDMVMCLRSLTLAGYAVKLPDLGIFKPAIRSKGAATAKEYNIKDDVRCSRIAFLPSGSMILSQDMFNHRLKFKRVWKFDLSQLEPPSQDTGKKEI